MILIWNKDEQDLIQRLRRIGSEGGNSVEAYAKELLDLKRELADLKIDKSRIVEDNAKQDRELRHMIGLEKKRQEVELEQTKREATLAVREENLKHERAEFERQLKFNTERFASMETYMKETFAQVMDRLPTVTVDVKRGKR